jgi:transcriptional regulator of NAD metabolism
MPDINTIKSAPSLKCVTNEQLNFDFISKKSKKNDLSNISQERLIKVIKKLVRVVKWNNLHSENIIGYIELIKNAKNLYEIHSSIKDIEENNEYIFEDTLDLSKDLLENEDSSDECIQTLIKLSKLGVFND